MCNVSNVGDIYADRWRYIPGITTPMPLQPFQPAPPAQPALPTIVTIPGPPVISREEFDALKRDVLEMKELLKAAKAEDERAGNPDCEMADKIAILRKVAEFVGIDLDDVFGGPAK